MQGTDPHGDVSRRLVAAWKPGRWSLTNSDLRQTYGIGRVTPAARARIAESLRSAGCEVLSDTDSEPLVIRKSADRGSLPVGTTKPEWWKRPGVVAVAAVVALLLIVGAATGGDDQSSSGTPQEAETTSTTAPDTTAEPAATLQDAADQVDEDHYAAALGIAAGLRDNDRIRIRRKIARRLARRAANALRDGDRSRARTLLGEAASYPSTDQVSAVRTDLTASTARAKARTAARRLAARQAVQRRSVAREAAAEQRRLDREQQQLPPEPDAAPATPSAPSAPSGGTCADTPATDIPVGPGDPRDRDGDGIACES